MSEQRPETIETNCAECSMRLKAEAKPKSLSARLWKWHTTWCPGWAAYQKSLEEQNAKNPAPTP